MGRGVIFLANRNLADILGDADFDYENLYFLVFSQISGLPAHLGASSWALLGPSTWAHLGPTHVGPLCLARLDQKMLMFSIVNIDV